MTTSQTQQIVGRVVDAVRAREDELVERMLARFAAEVPASGVGKDPDMDAAMRQSSHANIRAALRHIERGGPPLPSGPPDGAIEEARVSAQAGVPLAALLQTYRIGQSVVFDATLEAVDAMEDLDARMRSDALRVCIQDTFAYIDAVIPFVTDEFTRERDRLVRGREQRRVQLVRDLLEERDVDGGELGYELGLDHRAVVAWGAGADAELTRLAGCLGARLLAVAVAGQTQWGWLGSVERVDDRAVRAVLAEWPGGLAFGSTAAGPGGFRASPREARAAHRVGAATGDAVTFIDDVAHEALMLGDERAARAFVAAELGALDAARDGVKLRETLRAYFDCGFNASAAAAMLHVNDRTVAYRLNTAEQLLGRPVRGRHTELQAAIRLERVLGSG